MHRSTLAQNGHAVYAVAWGPESDQVVFSSGSNLFIKPIQSSSKLLHWEGHEGLVLKVDWNPINNSIISAGEDCRYKVWDCCGRLLYQSSKADYSITSLAWCPSGDVFAVGSFNSVTLCDLAGWPHGKEKLNTGSLLSVAWSLDGTQLAGAGGNGTVVFGQLVDKTIEWTGIIATLENQNRIRIQNILKDTIKELDFRDRVIKMSLSFQQLVVATASQCCIYSVTNWNTPHILDVKDSVILVKQCRRYFLLIDCFMGLQLFTYEGRHLSNPKFQGLRTESFNQRNVSLSNNVFAVIEHNDKKVVRFLDVNTGKLVGEVMRHSLDVVEIALNQLGILADQKLVLIDSNRDLFISSINRLALFKLASMVESIMWNEVADILVAVADRRLVVWYYPHAPTVDKDLLQYVKLTKDCNIGKNARFLSFYGPQCTVQRADGASISTNVSPHPFLLFEHVNAKQWDQALRLCRHVKDNLLWACLAGASMAAKELSVAEMAYAALDEVDKVHYIIYMKDLPCEEARQAELMLFRRRSEEAESILLQAGLTYRAISLNIRLFNWDRALELALSYKKTHLDTVLWYRQKYLQKTKHEETKEQFIHFAQQVVINVDHIKEKIKEEKERERRRSGANPLQTKPMWNISHRDMPAFTKAGLISGTKSESSNLLSNTVQIA
ncbi:uncharacterized protein [Physcomitrium patens]|nr:intraflagellar transport protein 80 homolog isoform X3 [Physcomitrium patens]XP_024390089.1 intraflagellar transport protein 80 homolog isoform X3 [Physcomitrium patens]|eukprot:XP_024390088.1 intraflagellar transport protein 80 homolog isoform X3 [Physcomitrella patens]